MEQIAAALIIACNMYTPTYSTFNNHRDRRKCLERVHLCVIDKEIKDSKTMLNKCLPLIYKGK